MLGTVGGGGVGGGQVGHRGQSDKKMSAFHRFHGKITHHSGGETTSNSCVAKH